MDAKLLWAIILTVLPIIELRGGMPFAVKYALDTGSNLFLVFFAIVLLNALIVIPIFLFLDFIHIHLIRFKWYERFSEKILDKARRKSKSIENKSGIALFIALAIFVAIPLPGTGAYTGALIAWVLNLNRKYSFIAIALGVLGAGIIVFLASFGIISLF